ncbi:MAG: hypothetical protein JWQ98_3333 [Chlorobi bacterium]|nr:hypothetical protein [Chlorobiota bacterium]
MSTFLRRPRPGNLLAICAFLFIVALPLRAGITAGTPPAGDTATFVSISDIHFNPLSDSAIASRILHGRGSKWEPLFRSLPPRKPGSYGEETTYPLLISMLDHMRKTNPHPKFIIITGDFLAHGFRNTFNAAVNRYGGDSSDAAYDLFIFNTFEFLTGTFAAYYPATPVIPALGNNDSYCGNYQVGPASEFLKDFARLWAPLMGRPGDQMKRQFATGGYYSIANPGVARHRIIVLNTIFFSAKYRNSCAPGAPDPGMAELHWLDSALADCLAKKERAWLVYHIPPGIDVFGSVDSSGICGPKPVPFLGDQYEAGFEGLLLKHHAVIEASFAGHTHVDDFRLLVDSGAAIGYIHISPAVSPVYDNNPAFQIFQFSPVTAAIHNYTTEYVDLNASEGWGWKKEYDFASAYGLPGYSVSTLSTLARLIDADIRTRAHYQRYFSVSSTFGNALTDRTWRAFWCGIDHWKSDDFVGCCGAR